MKTKFYYAFLLVFLFLLKEVESKEFIVLRCRPEAGMFSIFHDVLALVKFYDEGRYNGIEVDFANEGLYFDRRHGANWWNYYCEPICLGVRKNVKIVRGDPPFTRPFEVENLTTRSEAHRLIKKYIHVKSSITKKVNAFVDEHFTNKFVITLHYRATDKFIAEAQPIAYHKVVEVVNGVIAKYNLDDYKIFIATDDQRFLDFMSKLYGEIICSYDCIRSKDNSPIHLNRKNKKYECGEQALIDCLLLSKGHILIRTSSNLSKWSTFFNPKIPVVPLNF